jgi:hypothetical protein
VFPDAATLAASISTPVDLEAHFHVDLQLLLDPSRTGQLYLESGCSASTMSSKISLELTTSEKFGAELAMDRSFVTVEMKTMGDGVGVCPPGASKAAANKNQLGLCQLEFDVNVAVMVAAANRKIGQLRVAGATEQEIRELICLQFINRGTSRSPSICSSTTLGFQLHPSRWIAKTLSGKTAVVMALPTPSQVDYDRNVRAS